MMPEFCTACSSDTAYITQTKKTNFHLIFIPQIFSICLDLLCRAFPFDDCGNGLQEDLEVEGEGPILDIFPVETDNFLEIGDGRAAADLPHAGDPRLHGGADAVLQFIFLPLVQRAGAPADERHLPFENVEKLRKFIQRGITYEIAEPAGAAVGLLLFGADDARVVGHLEHHAILDTILGEQFFLALLGVHIHGAELIQFEGAAVLADAGLAEEDRAGVGFFDERAEDERQDPGDQAADDPAEDVCGAFDEAFAGGDEAEGVGDDAVAAELAGLPVLPFGAGEGFDSEAGGDAHIDEGVDQFRGEGHGVRLEDEDLIDPVMAELPDRLFVHRQDGDVL